MTLAALAAASMCVPLFRTAHAAEIDDKRAEAAALEAQIAENGRKLDALNEKINDAQVALDGARGRRSAEGADRVREGRRAGGRRQAAPAAQPGQQQHRRPRRAGGGRAQGTGSSGGRGKTQAPTDDPRAAAADLGDAPARCE